MTAVQMVGRRLLWSCHVCVHPVSAMSTEALQAAMEDHAAHINHTAPRDTDEHFAETRLDLLIGTGSPH